MKNLLKTIAVLLIFLQISVFAQADEHRWKPLVVNKSQKIWYDESQLDSVNSSKFEIWVLEMHTPPLTFDELPGKIYRSKTLYAVNLLSARYGIEKVIYYDVLNKELYNFDYKIENYPDDLKYSYPVMEKSTIHSIIKELYKIRGDKKAGETGN